MSEGPEVRDHVDVLIEIREFVRESNAIEGIYRKPSKNEIDATHNFLAINPVTLEAVRLLVGVYQPDAVLRDVAGRDVRVGQYIAPPGGPMIYIELEALLTRVNYGGDPWENHLDYERLHPFTDGNGRSGRALWAWQMIRLQGSLPLGFLHQFYYQTLSSAALTKQP